MIILYLYLGALGPGRFWFWRRVRLSSLHCSHYCTYKLTINTPDRTSRLDQSPRWITSLSQFYYLLGRQSKPAWPSRPSLDFSSIQVAHYWERLTFDRGSIERSWCWRSKSKFLDCIQLAIFLPLYSRLFRRPRTSVTQPPNREGVRTAISWYASKKLDQTLIRFEMEFCYELMCKRDSLISTHKILCG